MIEDNTIFAARDDLNEVEVNLRQALVNIEAVSRANLNPEQIQELDKARKRINNALMTLGMIY